MRRIGGLLVSVLLLFPMIAAAETASPTGFEKATFGMPLEDVKKLYPDMRELSFAENLGAVPVGGPYIERYVLRQQKVEGLTKPADIELRFWKGKFWLFIVYLGENTPESAVESLTKRYGPVTGNDPRYPIWNTPKTTILVELSDKRYTVNDEPLSLEAREWFVELLRKGRNSEVVDLPLQAPAQAAAPAASAPEPTPPSATPVGDSTP
jgi:hypothetical protein